MQFSFAHNNFNVRDLDRSLSFYKEALGLTARPPTIWVMKSSTWPSAWMISMPHTQSTRKWTASALKIRQWASILSPTRTATGWRSFPQSKQKTLGAAALSVFFILLTGLFCSFFDSGCILLKLSPDERTVSFESLP